MLHYQYIHGVTPIDLWDYDMSVPNSPHVELLRTIIKSGMDWEKLKKTRYVEERRLRFKLGMDRWTDEHIQEHIKVRWKIYRSMKKYGFKAEFYKTKHHSYPVRILGAPFWQSRFGFNAPWLHGPEIWDGGGRSAAAYVLGWDSIKAIKCVDVAPHSKQKGEFEKKLKNIQGVWSWLK